MALFKKYPAFFSSVILLLLVAVGGLTYIFIAAGQSGDAANKVKKAEANLRSALSLSPAPTEANVEASKENVAQLKQVLADQIASTKGTNSAILDKKPPTTNTNMYYDLLAYKNELDKDAKLITPIGKEAPGVTVPEGFNWGFSRFLQAGAGAPPPENAIPELFRQKVLLNYMLRKLLATQPQSIVSVQREPVTIEKPAASAKSSSNNKTEAKTDEFWMGEDTAAIPGVVETEAFRISFTGYSQNLRAFLKEIAAFEIPLVVRSVEVKPSEKPKPAANARSSSPSSIFDVFGTPSKPAAEEEPKASEQEPVVDSNISEFTVVIEYVDVTVQS